MTARHNAAPSVLEHNAPVRRSLGGAAAVRWGDAVEHLVAALACHG
jgi:hypothetical protein